MSAWFCLERNWGKYQTKMMVMLMVMKRSMMTMILSVIYSVFHVPGIVLRWFAHMKSLNPHNHHMRLGLLLFPFYRWENWGTQRLDKLLKIVPVSKWWRLSAVSWVFGPNSNDNTGQGQSSATAKTRFPWPPSWGQPTYFLSQPLSLAVHRGLSCPDGEPALWPWPQSVPAHDG